MPRYQSGAGSWDRPRTSANKNADASDPLGLAFHNGLDGTGGRTNLHRLFSDGQLQHRRLEAGGKLVDKHRLLDARELLVRG